MKRSRVRISKGGQVSVPSTVRYRWNTTELMLEDRGDSVVLWPLPPDPIAAARGIITGPGPSSAELIAEMRQQEIEAEDRKYAKRRPA